jgi:hypothetical protein
MGYVVIRIDLTKKVGRLSCTGLSRVEANWIACSRNWDLRGTELEHRYAYIACPHSRAQEQFEYYLSLLE